MNTRTIALTAAAVGLGGLVIYTFTKKATAEPPTLAAGASQKEILLAQQLAQAKNEIRAYQAKLTEAQQTMLVTQRELNWYKTRNNPAPGPFDPVRVPYENR